MSRHSTPVSLGVPIETCDELWSGIRCGLRSGHGGPHELVDGAYRGLKWHTHADEESDPVNRPTHYTSDPSGVECIQITRHRNFNIGNGIKYLWRAGLKDDPSQDARAKQIEDLRKAVWYINDEITRLESA